MKRATKKIIFSQIGLGISRFILIVVILSMLQIIILNCVWMFHCFNVVQSCVKCIHKHKQIELVLSVHLRSQFIAFQFCFVFVSLIIISLSSKFGPHVSCKSNETLPMFRMIKQIYFRSTISNRSFIFVQGHISMINKKFQHTWFFLDLF